MKGITGSAHEEEEEKSRDKDMAKVIGLRRQIHDVAVKGLALRRGREMEARTWQKEYRDRKYTEEGIDMETRSHRKHTEEKLRQEDMANGML